MFWLLCFFSSSPSASHRSYIPGSFLPLAAFTYRFGFSTIPIFLQLFVSVIFCHTLRLILLQSVIYVILFEAPQSVWRGHHS